MKTGETLNHCESWWSSGCSRSSSNGWSQALVLWYIVEAFPYLQLCLVESYHHGSFDFTSANSSWREHLRLCLQVSDKCTHISNVPCAYHRPWPLGKAITAQQFHQRGTLLCYPNSAVHDHGSAIPCSMGKAGHAIRITEFNLLLNKPEKIVLPLPSGSGLLWLHSPGLWESAAVL